MSQSINGVIERFSCCLNKDDNLEPLHSFNKFPVFMGCTKEPYEKDLFFDMDWFIGQQSGLIQLKKLLPLDVLYSKSHGSGEIGKIWDQHHEAFAHFINKSKPNSILEIGGAHGVLAKNYSDLAKIDWCIVEPNPNPIKNCPAKFIKGFFDDTFTYEVPIDTIVHSHVLEHIYEPIKFMGHIQSFMSLNNKLIFSLPNMKEMLLRNYTNCLNFEHTYFITETYVEKLLNHFGFEITNKEYFMDDHSIFYETKKVSNKINPLFFQKNLYAENKLIFNNFVSNLNTEVDRLNKYIENSSKKIFLFGAHIFSQFLISFGLNAKKIAYILDNDPNKQGRRLYGTNLFVKSPLYLKDIDSPVVILKAGIYNNEISREIHKNINSKTTFLE